MLLGDKPEKVRKAILGRGDLSASELARRAGVIRARKAEKERTKLARAKALYARCNPDDVSAF
jgi:hypothetical protein